MKSTVPPVRGEINARGSRGPWGLQVYKIENLGALTPSNKDAFMGLGKTLVTGLAHGFNSSN